MVGTKGDTREIQNISSLGMMVISTKADLNFVLINPLSEGNFIGIKNLLDLISITYRGSTKDNIVIDKKNVINNRTTPGHLDPFYFEGLLRIMK